MGTRRKDGEGTGNWLVGSRLGDDVADTHRLTTRLEFELLESRWRDIHFVRESS